MTAVPSGGSSHHGTVYGLFNSSQLNARDFFDTAFGNAAAQVTAGGRPVVAAPAYNFNQQTLKFEPWFGWIFGGFATDPWQKKAISLAVVAVGLVMAWRFPPWLAVLGPPKRGSALAPAP